MCIYICVYMPALEHQVIVFTFFLISAETNFLNYRLFVIVLLEKCVKVIFALQVVAVAVALYAGRA